MTPADGTDLLPVAETFGPTFQGEGPSTGRLAYFIRLGGCNLTCARCDTPYTWDATRYDLRKELTNMPAAAIAATVPRLAPLVVITGGEPLLYQTRPAMGTLLAALGHRRVEFETNGTIAPLPALLRFPQVRFNVSPKLDGPMSNDPEQRRIVPAALAGFVDVIDRVAFKFVVRTIADVDQAAALARTHSIPPHAVWIMPEGTAPDAILDVARDVAQHVLSHGFNFTTRLHVLLWPTTDRGR